MPYGENLKTMGCILFLKSVNATCAKKQMADCYDNWLNKVNAKFVKLKYVPW